VSPLNTLERGYSITTDAKTGKVVHVASEVERNQTINVRLQQGQLVCVVKDIKND
jgi:exodeoxyribonuclease VII large subunit